MVKVAVLPLEAPSAVLEELARYATFSGALERKSALSALFSL
jgi:hypothetical protein